MKSKAYKLLGELKKENIEKIFLKRNNNPKFQNFDDENIQSKQKYNFLIKTIILIPCFAKVNLTAVNSKGCTKHHNVISGNALEKQINDINHLYFFLMNSDFTKQAKWLKNLVPHPPVLDETEFETGDHLLFECKKFEEARKATNIANWNDVWDDDKRGIAQKYLVALVLSSWSDNIGKYLGYFVKLFPKETKTKNTTPNLSQ